MSDRLKQSITKFFDKGKESRQSATGQRKGSKISSEDIGQNYYDSHSLVKSQASAEVSAISNQEKMLLSPTVKVIHSMKQMVSVKPQRFIKNNVKQSSTEIFNNKKYCVLKQGNAQLNSPTIKSKIIKPSDELHYSRQLPPRDRPPMHALSQSNLPINTETRLTTSSQASQRFLPKMALLNTATSQIIDRQPAQTVQLQQLAPSSPPLTRAFSPSISLSSSHNLRGSDSEISLKLSSIGQKLQSKVEYSFEKLIREIKEARKKVLTNLRIELDGLERTCKEQNNCFLEVKFSLVASDGPEKLRSLIDTVIKEESLSIRVERDELKIEEKINALHGIHVETSFTQFFENNKPDFIDSFDPVAYFQRDAKRESGSRINPLFTPELHPLNHSLPRQSTGSPPLLSMSSFFENNYKG